MNSAEKIQEAYDTGYKVFEKLFPLTDKELKDKLKNILGEKYTRINDGILGENSGVRKEIYNERYNKIVIEFYDWIEITAFGIDFHPEHGEAKNMISFNKNFTL